MHNLCDLCVVWRNDVSQEKKKNFGKKVELVFF